jgi:REP element-mobilizing transposase RayT
VARRRRENIRRRSGLPEGNFHVVNRGARKLGIFVDDRDRSLFVQLMARYALKRGVQIIAWCLMPNHFHLELLASGATLPRFMHDLESTYALAFNRRHGTSGCVFQGRYRCIPIRSPEGLAYVSRYIHANPRDLGIRPDGYGWSSCRSYLGIAPTPNWLHPGAVFEAIRKRGVADSVAYREYLSAVPPKRPKPSSDRDEYTDLDIERIRRLEERLTEHRTAFPKELGKTSLRTLVCFAARMIHEIPAQAVARYYGYHSVHSVHTIVSRLQARMATDSGFQSLAEGDLF